MLNTIPFDQLTTIVMDVEGTTTSIDFVHQTLFPYSNQKMNEFVHDPQNRSLIRSIEPELWATLREEGEFEIEEEQRLNTVALTLLKWIQEDRKHPSLKKIQGYIWEFGYKCGDLKGHIYSDVPEAFQRWRDKGLSLGIYSSGSVLAQKLLFKHSDYGDLTPCLDFHFDTSVGGKREVNSYRKIAEARAESPSQMLFLSDIPEELLAARSAGFWALQIVREGTVLHPDFQSQHAFDFSFF